ncbi:RNA-directed DNA polymerase from transposon BS [Paramuricea clavata]|uniref:RNA-directed DNA polymerase from transposon BS n=1 Tax=Paramuricea clavata TaxID=317549 RepID=A0A6S7K5A6_PARCT|nr:RNA-directed DNA polymerase from transposon BS [Paramuricea clavata]
MQSLTDKHEAQQHPWITVSGKSKGHPINLELNNNNNKYSALHVEDDTEIVIDSDETKASVNSAGSRNKYFPHHTPKTKTTRNLQDPKPRSTTSAQQRKIAILGDSMIKGINSRKLQHGLKQKVIVKTFPGAHVEDMTHYVKPTLASNPAEVIVHIGTNDLKNKSPSTLLKTVDNLGEMSTESKDVKLTLSEIITRCDDETLADKLNITSLTKHIDELRILITEMNFDILCINETRIDKKIKNSEIGLQGYDLTRRDRNRRGGGVAIYIRNTIPYVERSTIIPENVEAVCIEVRKPNAKPILILTWYRPPNSNSEILDSFEIFLQNIDTENKEIIITGDFNIDLMPSETENNLIICKTDDPKTATTDVVELGISDHNLVYTCRKVGICKQKPKIIETRQYHKLNNAKFQNDLKQALLHINEHSDPNTALQEWNRIFLLIADINAPKRLRKVRSDRQPWMTDEIKNSAFTETT